MDLKRLSGGGVGLGGGSRLPSQGYGFANDRNPAGSYIQDDASADVDRNARPPGCPDALGLRGLKVSANSISATQEVKAEYRRALRACEGRRSADSEIANQNAVGGGNPSPQQTESTSITSCDRGGCWANDGTRFNKGAGNTSFSSQGQTCQKVGNTLHCN